VTGHKLNVQYQANLNRLSPRSPARSSKCFAPRFPSCEPSASPACWPFCRHLRRLPSRATPASKDNRGCADAKAGSYDRAHRNADYEKGWQACKTQPQAAAATGAPSRQEQACLAAVSNKSNNGEVTVLNSEFSQANSVVMIGVGSQRARGGASSRIPGSCRKSCSPAVKAETDTSSRGQ
jgi:hypothetical protein